MRKFGLAIVLAFSLVTLLSSSALAAASVQNANNAGRSGNGGNTHCIPRDTKDLTPTLEAPAWYVPGVTQPCDRNTDGGIQPYTAYWVGYAGCGGNCSAWRTTPDNADDSATDCVNSYTTCGTQIIGDANDFYYTCTSMGLSASQVATNIRYWAARAIANGTNWRVYTYTENGGYPYTCQFSVVELP